MQNQQHLLNREYQKVKQYQGNIVCEMTKIIIWNLRYITFRDCSIALFSLKCAHRASYVMPIDAPCVRSLEAY